MRPAVFLDRDGTLIQDVGYLSRVEDVQWFPWSIDAIRLLNRAGFLVCITTNQGGIGLGFYGPDLVHRVHGLMVADVEASGGRLDALYFCPHHPEATVETWRGKCDCRKPRPGMVRQAMAEFEIDIQRSYVVGDKLADVELANNVGARPVLVRTGYGEAELVRHGGQMPRAAFVADTVLEAAAWILSESGHPKETA